MPYSWEAAPGKDHPSVCSRKKHSSTCMLQRVEPVHSLATKEECAVHNTWRSAQQNHPGRLQPPGPRILFFNFFLVLHFIYFVCEGAVACIQRPEDKWLESALSFPRVGPRDWTQFVRLGSKGFYPWIYLFGPHATILLQLGNGGRARTKDMLSNT